MPKRKESKIQTNCLILSGEALMGDESWVIDPKVLNRYLRVEIGPAYGALVWSLVIVIGGGLTCFVGFRRWVKAGMDRVYWWTIWGMLGTVYERVGNARLHLERAILRTEWCQPFTNDGASVWALTIRRFVLCDWLRRGWRRGWFSSAGTG